jgi:membrane-associated phospholipid phosphatase
MMKQTTWIKLIPWLAAVLFLALAALFAVTDLTIMQRISNPQSGWAHLFEAYGQLPGTLTGFMGGSILLKLAQQPEKKTFKDILGIVLLMIAALLLGLGFWGDAMGMQVDGGVNIMLVAVMALISLVAVQIVLQLIAPEKLATLKPFAQTALWLFILANLVVWAIKIPWGRWTYRDILEVGDLTLFSPWYLPQGNTGHHAFISGHTANAFCVLPLTMLFRKDPKRRTIAWIAALLWGAAAAFSRVVIGAHFPSDVLFAAGVTLLLFILLRRRFLNRAEKVG